MSQTFVDQVSFAFPERRDQPALAEAYRISQIIADTFPYSGNGIWRPEEAIVARGGNCFAQALGGLSLMREWGIPSGILLTRQHAAPIAVLNNNVFCIEPATVGPEGDVTTLRQHGEAFDEGGKKGKALAAAYKQARIMQALQAGNCVRYFYCDESEPSKWLTEAGQDLPQLSNPKTALALTQRVILDGERGEATLRAIGQLHTYGKNSELTLMEHYDELIGEVPSFFGVPQPVGR